jgi:nucleoside-diphosphate-sugar epimerase
MDSSNIALVVGSSGIIGHAVTETLSAHHDWRVRALRRTLVPDVATVDCDLNDAAATAAALHQAADTTHVFYAAYRPEPDPQRTAQVNTAMLRNVIDGLRAAGAPLRRVVHFQGVKAYGVHLGPPSTPFYEDDPRHLAVNFYQQQEDLLRERSLHGQFSWTALRPDAIVGDIAGNPMNIALVLGVYAALSRDAGLPLRFPGSLHTYRNVLAELTDARWLARASLWAALAPCRPQRNLQPGGRTVSLGAHVAQARRRSRHGSGGSAADVAVGANALHGGSMAAAVARPRLAGHPLRTAGALGLR